MTSVCINLFTDPGCPWAYSAEPFRRRLQWLYRDEIEWQIRLVGLAESPDDYEAKGFTTGKMASSLASIAELHGMPIDTRERPRLAATVPACRAVVAARRHAPDKVMRTCRQLRIRNFSGELLDDDETIFGAAADAGIDRGDLDQWLKDEEVERDLRKDMADARKPMPAARVLDHKLANWSGGRRYTCPSYEIVRLEDGVKISVPGFQPFAVYDVITANLVPGLERNENPGSVREVLDWACEPLATKEVAVVCDISLHEARQELGLVAHEQHVGTDGFWTLRT